MVGDLGLDYPTAWGRRYGARIARELIQRTFLGPYTRYMSTLEVRGAEHTDIPGPVLFVANHTSNLDTPLVLTALPARVRRRTVVAAAMDTFFMDRGRAFRTVLMFNAIPIDRHRVNRRSAELALELLQDGWNLLIYPEGGRTPDGALQEFKGGAAYLAERAHATVVLTYIHEAGFLRGPKYAKAPHFVNSENRRRHHVIVTFGTPLRLAEGETIRRFGPRIEDAVVQLGRAVSGDSAYGLRPSGE